MNKIIPFSKDIKFDDAIGEITAIAIDDTLSFKDDYTITGELIIKGSHKYGDILEDFNYPIPTSITVDNKYDTTKAKITIDDFYYEIINDDILKIKIDLILDNLLYKEERIEPIVEEVKLEEKDDNIKVEDENTLEINDEKDYSIYRVYVVSEKDNLSNILEKYNITSEELSHYNNIENIKPGVKLIIPSIDE